MAGRPREFDENHALLRAMEVFWSHGFEPASISTLVDHMGVNAQSIYNCFGDKNQLFVRALEYYVEKIATPMFDILNDRDADIVSIEAYFDYLLNKDAVTGEPRRGCLMVNTMVEMANTDDAIAQALVDFQKTMRRAFRNALKGARQRHQISAEIQLGETAEFLVNTVLGLMVSCKSGTTRKSQDAIVRLALRSMLP